jgi:putative sterol carrier protein
VSARARPPDDIAPGDFFTRWVPEAVDGDPQRRARLGETDAVIEFELTGEATGTWTVRVESGRVSGHHGGNAHADLRVRVDTATWRALNRGELSAPEALLRRKVHLRGSFLLALKLHLILG